MNDEEVILIPNQNRIEEIKERLIIRIENEKNCINVDTTVKCINAYKTLVDIQKQELENYILGSNIIIN